MKDTYAREEIERIGLPKRKIDRISHFSGAVLYKSEVSLYDQVQNLRRDIDLLLSHLNLTPRHITMDKWDLVERTTDEEIRSAILALENQKYSPRRKYTRRKKVGRPRKK